MAGIGVRITGLRERVRDLEALGVDVDDLKDAFGAIATRAAEVARGFVPHRSGRLEATTRPNRAKNKAVVTVGRATVPYAAVINYGWPKRNIKAAGFVPQTDRVMQPVAEVEIEKSIEQIIRKRGL